MIMDGEERTIVVDLRFSHKFVVAVVGILLIAVLAGYLLISQDAVTASAPAESSAVSAGAVRKFFLSKQAVPPPAAASICAAAPGYHFASLWEIADVSNLEYDTTYGRTTADGVQGPPAAVAGWMRTGRNSGALAGNAGVANCNLWTSLIPPAAPGGGFGTIAALPDDWTAGDHDIGVWEVAVSPCNAGLPVWCAED
jgi:hypothetical protein